jgi:hypothetical protein
VGIQWLQCYALAKKKKKKSPLCANLFVKNVTGFREEETFPKTDKGIGLSFKKRKNRSFLTKSQDTVARHETYFESLRNGERGSKKPVIYTMKLYYTPLKCWRRAEG